MASGRYAFIDIAVLENVRQRFAAGEALALLSVDLDEVLWANGAGAALFGHSDVEAVVGASPGLGFVARRQIAAVPGFPSMDRDRGVTVRLARGVTSRALRFDVASVTLPDGTPAVLLAAPPAGAGAEASVVSGFQEPGYFAALLDGAGAVLAASKGFPRLEIAPATLAGLVAEAARESDRLVKRLIPAGRAVIPAGIARLADEPARHLLIGINAPVDEAAPEEAGAQSSGPDMAAPSDADLPDRVAEAPPSPAPERTEKEAAPRSQPGGGEADDWYFAATRDPAPAMRRPEAAKEATGESAGEATAEVASAAAAAARPAQVKPDLTSGPVRFVWRTDATGAFSAISPEFTGAVGSQAADVIGRPFREAAARLGIDPDGEIASLLERRDTWSGRTVLWPVSGTDLAAPVDLAALPVYNRDRVFEGFRGFGVVRMDEAAPDPGARGLGLGDGGADEATAAAVAQEAPHDTDPFRNEVPVISIAERLNRRISDKIIRLAEHRPPQPEQAAPEQESPGQSTPEQPIPDRPTFGRRLSAGERTAFEEIRDRLRRDTAAADAPATSATSATGATRDAGRGEDEEPADGDFSPVPDVAAVVGGEAVSTQGQAETAARTSGPEAAGAEPDDRPEPLPSVDAAEAAEADRAEPVRLAGGAEPPADAAAEAVTSQTEAETEAEFEAGERKDEADGTDAAQAAAASLTGEDRRAPVDPELISGLPLPLLVHAGDELYFANREFLDLTGYSSLDQIRKEGGLDRLFVEDEPSPQAAADGRKLRLRTLGGEVFAVDAHLQSIGWGQGTALLLALKRAAPPARPSQEAAQAVSPDTALPAPASSGAVSPQAAGEMRELERHLAELRTIIDTATDGVVLIAPDGTIRNISRPAEALFGFDSAGVEGKPFASLFAIESQKPARDYLAGLADNGVASVLNDGREVIGREAEGRFIPLFMTIGRLPENSGYCAVMRDITQFKRAEEELTQARAQAERASSQKTDFLARISHEIRTPLNAIIGFSELMMDEKFGPIGSDRYRDYLRDINRSGNHVLDLVNDLLDISKIEAGEQEMNYEAVSLNEALSEAVAMMQPQANRERVIIRSSLASRLPDVVADLRSVRQIALNLLSNAIRYTQAGGQVIVSTAYEASGDVTMRLRDTGIGMTLAEIDQALKPFKQINALKRGRHDGTGLGLPLTKAMVEANRARFAISSTPGEGTLVEIVFPSTRVLAE